MHILSLFTKNEAKISKLKLLFAEQVAIVLGIQLVYPDFAMGNYVIRRLLVLVQDLLGRL